MSTYITSDLHFFHDRDFIFSVRGFTNIFDHDNTVKNHIYSTVQPGDDLVLLGDVAMSKDKKEILESFFKTLIYGNGVHITWVQGNHDNPKHIDYFTNMFGKQHITIFPMTSLVTWQHNKMDFVMSHFPWKGQPHKNADVDPRKAHLPFPVQTSDSPVLLHGHTHRKEKFETDAGQIVSYHVGWDSHSRIINLDEIVETIQGAIS